jgi:hypothetical protein
LRRALRRRPAVTAGLVVVALAVAGTAIAVTAGGSGGPPTSVSIAISSARPPDTGDVYVVYDDGNDSSAQISGQVPDAASGQVARLYAQPFPFTAAPAPVASLALQPTGDSARYAFTVTPSVATRYDVEVFSSGTATTPTDRSPVSTVYVTTGASSSYSQNCTSGTCVITMTFTVTVPAAEMRTEIAKPLYLYFGDTLASSGSTAPTPTSVQLGGGDAKASPNQQVSATQFRFTATFTYQVGSGDSHWAQDLCAKDSVAQDGIGLPGSHNCGDSSLHFPPGYLG